MCKVIPGIRRYTIHSHHSTGSILLSSNIIYLYILSYIRKFWKLCILTSLVLRLTTGIYSYGVGQVEYKIKVVTVDRPSPQNKVVIKIVIP